MCRDYVDLLPLLDSGELSEAEDAWLRGHLQSCPACLQDIEMLGTVPILIGRPPRTGWAADVQPAIRARLATRPPSGAGLRDRGRLRVAGVQAGPAAGRRGRWTVGGLLAAMLLGLVILLVVVLPRDPNGHPGLLGTSVRPPPPAPLLDPTTALTQTVGGYTFILRPVWGDTDTGQVHADSLQIVLDYVVLDPRGRPLPPLAHRWTGQRQPDLPQLTDASGVTLPWLGAASHTGTNPADGSPIFDSALAFDAGPVRDAQAVRTLRLTVRVPLDFPTFVTKGGSPGPGSAGQVVGPFTFTFRLPFDPRRSVTIGPQTVTAHAVPITLERVIVTRAEARVTLRFASPDGGAVTRWQAWADLAPASGPSTTTRVLPLGVQLNEDATIYGWPGDGTWAGSLLSRTDLLQKSGPWTLTIHDLQVTSGFRLLDVAGPWVFHFTIPPGSSASP